MTPTKNASTAKRKPATQTKRAAGTRARRNGGKPATSPETAGVAAAAPYRNELTRIQKIAIDALSDLIVNGGNGDDEDSMIHAALGHYWRRFWSESNRDPKELGDSVSKFIEDNYRDWQADLTLAWKMNRKAPGDFYFSGNTASRPAPSIRYSASLRKAHENKCGIERNAREIADLFEQRELTGRINIEAFVLRFPECL